MLHELEFDKKPRSGTAVLTTVLPSLCLAIKRVFTTKTANGITKLLVIGHRLFYSIILTEEYAINWA